MNTFVGILLICLFAYTNANSVCPKIYSKSEWGGKKGRQVEYGIRPTDYVIIHHTVTPQCTSLPTCSSLISNMQNFHMEELLFHDIGYNFLIDSEGNIYEGVGWHRVGAHTRGYNSKSIGIAFIGTYTEITPSRKSIAAAKKLLECGVEERELVPKYKLLGARQVSTTLSPGLMLYTEIQKWDHFVNKP